LQASLSSSLLQKRDGGNAPLAEKLLHTRLLDTYLETLLKTLLEFGEFPPVRSYTSTKSCTSSLPASGKIKIGSSTLATINYSSKV
jgi:hypothetical protein